MTQQVENIQISGDGNRGMRMFEDGHWREAIFTYLQIIWAGDQEFGLWPRITFNGITFQMNPREEYIVYSSTPAPVDVTPRVSSHEILFVGELTRAEVENGLVRFARNNQIQQISFLVKENDGAVILTKGRKRGELFVTSMGSLPSFTEIAREASLET